jgi:ABC-type uncharacterized transport system permease subunit
MPFSPLFIIVKTLVMIVSLPIILWNPKATLYVLLANIAVTIPESIIAHNYLIALLALLLSLWTFELKWNDPRVNNVAAFLVIYSIWNALFYYSNHPDLFTAIPQVIIPLMVGLWYLLCSNEPNKTLHVFLLIRLCILLVLCFHVMSSNTCHRVLP